MSGICSAHRHHESGCPRCEALNPFQVEEAMTDELKEAEARLREWATAWAATMQTTVGIAGRDALLVLAELDRLRAELAQYDDPSLGNFSKAGRKETLCWKKGNELAKQLVAVLAREVGKTGESEGAVAVAERIIRERDEAQQRVKELEGALANATTR